MNRDGSPGLIETMRALPGAIPWLARHLARLGTSASELGINCPLDRIRAGLEDATAGLDAAAKVRVRLEPTGEFVISTGPLPSARDRLPGVIIARQRSSSRDPLLRHKTTRRDLFEAARAEIAGMHDVAEALLLNERGELCEGTISNVFLMFDGHLLTPTSSCGLLPGIMRSEVLKIGRAREVVVTAGDLRRAERLFLTNAVRGMIEVNLLH